MSEIKMLPCPFCGSSIDPETDIDDWGIVTVTCPGCGLGASFTMEGENSHWQASEEETIEAWNRRSK